MLKANDVRRVLLAVDPNERVLHALQGAAVQAVALEGLDEAGGYMHITLQGEDDVMSVDIRTPENELRAAAHELEELSAPESSEDAENFVVRTFPVDDGLWVQTLVSKDDFAHICALEVHKKKPASKEEFWQ